MRSRPTRTLLGGYQSVYCYGPLLCCFNVAIKGLGRISSPNVL